MPFLYIECKQYLITSYGILGACVTNILVHLFNVYHHPENVKEIARKIRIQLSKIDIDISCYLANIFVSAITLAYL